MSVPHILAIPYPEQGHVIPLLELSQCLALHGFRVTFVNSDYNHNRIVRALEEKNYIGDTIRLVSIPDGQESLEDRYDLKKSIQAIFQVMPVKLEELIKEINKVEAEKITLVIADGSCGWAIEIAKKLNIKSAAFWPTSATSFTMPFYAPKLLEDGIIDNDGTLIKKQMIQLDPNMPAIFNSEDLYWNCFGNPTIHKPFFEILAKNQEVLKLADYFICNSAYDLEPAAFTSIPKVLPIGPLLASSRLGHSAGCFWSDDPTCLKWLDQQPPHSVIYVAFGSITVLDKIQFNELALGLELCNRPFLWVVRPGITNDAYNAYPEGFEERVSNRGLMVSWAPQQKVLSHPSIACFLSHCGWNSTVEGISNGVPFLCWPCFADQFLDQSYICDIWKVGLKFGRNENGIITREEIKNKVDQVVGDENFKARAFRLKEIVLNSVNEGGHSHKMFRNFLEWIKA